MESRGGPDMSKFPLWSQEEVRTWRKDEFLSNLACFGSRNGILTKWHNDSASFLPEKLKVKLSWPKILIFNSKYQKDFQKQVNKYLRNKFRPQYVEVCFEACTQDLWTQQIYFQLYQLHEDVCVGAAPSHSESSPSRSNLADFPEYPWANGPRSRYTRYTGTVQYLGIPRKTNVYLFWKIFGVLLIKYLRFWTK